MALVTSLLAACSSGGDASPETTATTPTVTATTCAEGQAYLNRSLDAD